MDHARAEFAAAWAVLQPTRTEADFEAWRCQRAWTAWKYAMWDAGMKMPTQSPDHRARCLCGVPIDIPSMASHVYTAHMSKRQQLT
jgi:hypothetical protein